MKVFSRAPLSLLVLCACSAPVFRGDNTPPPAPKAPEPQPIVSALPDLKKRLWILPFKEAPETPEGLELKTGAAQLLRQKVLNQLSEGEARSAYVGDAGVETPAGVDSSSEPKDLAKMARMAGYPGFVRGEVTELRLTANTPTEGLFKTQQVELVITLNFELFDAASSRRIASGFETQTYTETRTEVFRGTPHLPNADAKVSELGQHIAERMMTKLSAYSDKLGWSGRIVKTEATRVYINAGRRTGIQVGDILKVVESPQEVVDPVTGNSVGQAPGRMKGTIKVMQNFGGDGAIAVLQSGGGLVPGDRVELY